MRSSPERSPDLRTCSRRPVTASLWLCSALALGAICPVASAGDGLVVRSGAAKESMWVRLIERNDLPSTPGPATRTLDAVDEGFIEPLRAALMVEGSDTAAKAYDACEAERQTALQLVLTAREELDAQQWLSAIEHLERAKTTWHCSAATAPLTELSEVYFLEGVAWFLSGRRQGASPFFSLAYNTGVEPPGVIAWPPEVREAYYNTVIDTTLVPRVPVTVELLALDGLKLWIDGQPATDLYEIAAGEHVVQVTRPSGRLLASALIQVDPAKGGGVVLPTEVLPVTARLDTLRALDEALAKDRLSFAMQGALSRVARAEGLDWLVVSAVDTAAGDLASFTAYPVGEGAYSREHLRGVGLGEVSTYVYPAATGALVLGALGGGAGYAASYNALRTELFPNEEAVQATQRRGYTGATIGIACATGALVTGVLWVVDRRRKRYDLIYGQRLDLSVDPTSGALLTGRF